MNNDSSDMQWQRDLFMEMKVSQDVPKYMLVSGERPELRGLNVVGLTRRGFSDTEVYADKMFRLVQF